MELLLPSSASEKIFNFYPRERSVSTHPLGSNKQQRLSLLADKIQKDKSINGGSMARPMASFLAYEAPVHQHEKIKVTSRESQAT